jgi:nickel/cobalt exporter
MWTDILAYLVSVQTTIREAIAGDIRAFTAGRDWIALLAVLPVGAVFGALHALTPGHSKMVLATYLAGSPLRVIQGIGVALILSLTHIVSAVAIALLALPLVQTSLTGAGRAPLLEDLSRGMLAAIGIWMVVRAWRNRTEHHAEAPYFGAMAGLIPCPLTLFTMVFAMSRGVPEAGLVFAAAMMLGVMFTLSVVATLVVFARDWSSRLMQRHGTRVQNISRILEAGAGVLLLVIGLREVLLR